MICIPSQGGKRERVSGADAERAQGRWGAKQILNS